MRKSNIISFILGAVVLGTISTVFAYTLFANNVGYEPQDEAWEVDNVKSAIDDLHKKVTERDIFCVALSGDKDTLGSKYGCNLGDGKINYLYLLKSESATRTLIMQENIATGMTWYNAMNYLTTGAGSNLNTTWSNVSYISLPSAKDIADAVGNYNWKVENVTKGDDFCFGNINSSACIYQGSTSFAQEAKKYNYLFDYTRECANFGCSNSLNSSYAFGYWTKDEDSQNSNYAWYVDRKGAITEDYEKTQSSYFGVRLVVKVRDYNLSK